MDPRRVPVTTMPRLPSSNRITLPSIQSRGDSIEHQPLVLYLIFHLVDQLSVNTTSTLLVNINNGLTGQVTTLEMEKEAMGNKKPSLEPRRVVVTGMGVETPLGHDPHTFYDNLLQGKSGISHIESFDCSAFPTVSSIIRRAYCKFFLSLAVFLLTLYMFLCQENRWGD